MPELPTVSVIIPTYNRAAQLADVLAPLLTDPAVSEIVVVNDGSTDDTDAVLEELSRRWSTLRATRQVNAGQSHAQQTGAEAARSEVLLFLDDDVVAGPGLAAKHAELHQGHASRLVVGFMPVHIPEPRRPGEFAPHLYDREYRAVCIGYDRDPVNIFRQLWAGNFSIRRDTALRIGLVPRLSLPYHNEQDFGLRCWQAGMEPVFRRDLAAEHLYRRSLKAFAYDGYRQGVGRARLIQSYPELVSPSTWQPDYARPVAAFLRAAGTGPIHPLVYGGLVLCCELAGRVRLWSLETTAARVLRQVEIARGMAGVAPKQARKRRLRFRSEPPLVRPLS